MLELSNEVSLGDLFTGVSILLSAIGIAISQMYERKKTSRIARVTALESSVQSLSKALIIGLKLAERLKWARFEKDTVSDKEIVDFGFGLENRIVLAKHSAFALWATKQEREILEELATFSKGWNEKYAASLAGAGEMPSFGDFLDEIKRAILNLATSIRKTF